MFASILKLAPAALGAISSVLPVFGKLHKKADANHGATLGSVIGGAGLFSNPTFMGFVADLLEKAAALVRGLPG